MAVFPLFCRLILISFSAVTASPFSSLRSRILTKFPLDILSNAGKSLRFDVVSDHEQLTIKSFAEANHLGIHRVCGLVCICTIWINQPAKKWRTSVFTLHLGLVSSTESAKQLTQMLPLIYPEYYGISWVVIIITVRDEYIVLNILLRNNLLW